MGERIASRLNRRQVLALGIGALVVAAVPVASARGRRRLVRRRIPVMGTVAEIAVVADGADGDAASRRVHAAIDAAFADLRLVDATMTSFSHDSDVGRANLGAARDGVVVGDETAFVVAEALRWADASDGAFDPCLGAVGKVWDVQHRTAPPDASLFARFAGRHLHRAVDVSDFRGARAIRFTDPDVRIDLGGIAKGYAVDRAAGILREHGFHDGLVNVGGDLVALGHNAADEPWRVGIQSPDAPLDAADPLRVGETVGEVGVSDAAVATSGDYVRFFQWHGRRYHHLLDPATGAPRDTPEHSLTIQAPTCMQADAAATALYGAPSAAAPRVLAVRAAGARVVLAV